MTRIEHMFESHWSPFEVSLGRVASTRDGWVSRADDPREGERLLGVDVDALDPDEALSALVSLSEHEAAVAAMRARLLVRVSGATQVVRDVLVEPAAPQAGGARRVEIVDEVAAEVAAVLRMPEATLRNQVWQARLLTGPLSRTLEELRAGRISSSAAVALCEQAGRMLSRPLGDDAATDEEFAQSCARLQDRVLPHAGAETASRVRARARRVVDTIDAQAAWQRRRRARRGCDVQAWGQDDGLAVVMARMPALHAAMVMARIEERVRADADRLAAAVADRTGAAEPTLGQLRAAAFTELVLDGTLSREGLASGGGTPVTDGGAVGRRARVEVQVLVDARTLAGLTPDALVHVQVGGESVAVGRDDLVDLLARKSTPALLRRLVCDPVSGSLADRGAHAYAVSPDLAAWIAARDRTCRHPGCNRQATGCDVDHAVGFDEGGATTVANTGALCRRHHNVKTHAGWRIVDSQSNGSCTFISPTGRRFPHSPVRLLAEPPP